MIYLKNKKSLFVLFLILVISSCSWYYDHQLFEVRFGLVNLINKKQFEQVSELFFYPDTFSQEHLRFKKQTVAEKFELVTSKLGNIKYTNNHDPNPKYEVTIYSTDRKDFKLFTEQTGGIFPSHFSKAGSGYLGIYFYKELLSGLEVFKVVYEIDSLGSDLIEEFSSYGIAVERIYTTSELKSEFGDFYDQVIKLFCITNPRRYENNLKSFYISDVEKLLPFLKSCKSGDEFIHFIQTINNFDLLEHKIDDPKFKEAMNEYKILSRQIWEMWLEYKNS